MTREHQIVLYPEYLIFKDVASIPREKKRLNLVAPRSLVDKVDYLAARLDITTQEFVNTFVGISLAVSHIFDQQNIVFEERYITVGGLRVDLDEESLLQEYTDSATRRKSLVLQEWVSQAIQERSETKTAFVKRALALGISIVQAAREEEAIGWPNVIPMTVLDSSYCISWTGWDSGMSNRA